MQNIRLLIYVTLFTTLAFATQSHSQPKDVNGWKGAKWGMTIQQVKNVFGNEISEDPDAKEFQGSITPLFIDSLAIGNSSYKVQFTFDAKSKFLKRVLIEPKNSITAIVSMKDLDERLTKKYGQPIWKQDENTRSMEKLNRTWVFPSSTIELKYLKIKSTNGVFALLIYTKKEEEENL